MSLDDRKIAAEAADWLLKLQDDRTSENLAQFVDWLEHSPKHMGEFVLAMNMAQWVRQIDPEHDIDLEALMSALPDSSAVIPHPSSLHTKAPAQHAKPAIRVQASRRLVGFATAAAIGTIALVTWQWPLTDLFGQEVFSTALGEQRSFQLEDGSLLHLNTQSRLKVRYTDQARNIQLLAGEVLFDVAPDAARPFRVTAGTTTIQAIGTQFNVYQRLEQVTVAVVEGKVQIEPKGYQSRSTTLLKNALSSSATMHTSAERETLLSAGEEAAVDRAGHLVKRAADVAAAIAWRQHRLVFRSERLEDIAVQFNRYNRIKLKVDSQTLADQRASGTFNANELNTFIQFLEQDSGIEIERVEGSILVRAK